MGDSLLKDEWNVIQLFSFFLHLPVKAYLLLTGSTEGIHLAFRHLFLLFHATVSLAVYMLIRKQGPISLFVLLIYGLFVPVGIFAVSYYSLAVAFSVLIGLLLAFTGLSRWTSVLIGVLFAGLVLANPFMAVLFFLYVLSVVGISVRSKTRDFKNNPSDYFGPQKPRCGLHRESPCWQRYSYFIYYRAPPFVTLRRIFRICLKIRTIIW